MLSTRMRGQIQCHREEIKERNRRGQPVLVGTISIEKSEELSRLLKKQGIPTRYSTQSTMRRRQRSSPRQGKESAVTIATNMAGRGTDIVLGMGLGTGRSPHHRYRAP